MTSARSALRDSLARVGDQIPGDRWILSQRVHYLGEEGRWIEALALAEGCARRSDGWWCQALRGYALHHLERYARALEAFGSALSAMEEADPDRREEWLDLEPLLDRQGDDFWADANPPRRETLRRRFWTLGDPLHLAPGNDRLTEHYARHAAAWIREDARNPYDLRWASDLAELLVRYGFEVGWERIRDPGSMTFRAPVVGHHHPESRAYLPEGATWSLPLAMRTGPDASASYPRSTHVPAYAPRLRDRPFQVATFRRGDELLVAAGYRLDPDSTAEEPRRESATAASATTDRFDSAPVRPAGASAVAAGLFLVHPDAHPDSAVVGRAVREVADDPADRGVLRLRAPISDYVVRVEVWDRVEERAARAGVGVRMEPLPPDVAALSDLVLLDPRAREAGGDGDAGETGDTGETEDTLRSRTPEFADAIDRMRPFLEVCAGETVAVGWEVYGLGLRLENVEFRLGLEEGRAGFFTRAGRWLGILGDPAPVTLEWSEEGPSRLEPFFRTVDMTFPSDLERGRYVLGLDVALEGREPLRVERTIEVPEGC